MASTITIPRRIPNAQIIQNFHLVWFNKTIDEFNFEDCSNALAEVQQIVNNVNMFTDVEECIDFITDIKDEKTFMIVSGDFNQSIISIVEDISQVNSIYVFCRHNPQQAKWTAQSPKVKGIYTDIALIGEALKEAAYQCDQNLISMSFVGNTTEASNTNLDTLDQSFMNTQILKEILLTIDFKQTHIDEFLTYCREQFVGNKADLEKVDKIVKEYSLHEPIWWYTSNSFLYSMVNRALRLMDVDLIVKMGFFLRGVHDHITALHAEQYGGQHHSDSLTVYRGQGLSQTDFDHLKRTQGGLLAFNSFLSTSQNHDVSLIFARKTIVTSNLVGVFFVLKIDPVILATPFASVKDVSCYRKEDEVLFSMHSVFRIGQVSQTDRNDRLWQVELTLTSDNDPQLFSLTEQIRKETFPELAGWERLARMLVHLGKFHKVEALCEMLLQQPTDEIQKPRLFNQLGQLKLNKGEYEEAIIFFEKELEIWQKILPPNHPFLATSQNNLGTVYEKMGQYLNALSYYEKALQIGQKTLLADHPDLASSYSSIGVMYDRMGDYLKALSYCEKALEIQRKTLPGNHPLLAISHNNVGVVYDDMGEYSKAFSYYEKALEIQRKALPKNHPLLRITYNSIAGVYEKIGQYSNALSYYEKALEIEKEALPTNHPDLAVSYNNIGLIYYKMGDYTIALSYYEKTLEISRKTLSKNHPFLACFHNNIAGVYGSMGDYTNALSYYEKKLEIQKVALLTNHPDLAISYNNIGFVYNEIGEYLNALSYHRKALQIRQKTLPTNHPDLAISYNNIGFVYNKIGEYLNALSYFKKEFEIWRKTLPENHPHLAISHSNLGMVYANMGDYSNALSYYKGALEIQQKILPPSHPCLFASHSNVSEMYEKLGDYSNAHSHLKRALDIFQCSLSHNH